MNKRLLAGKSVPAVGLGCMGMSEFYGATDDQQSLQTLQAAYDMGYRHFDTSDMYGRGHNEGLLGRFMTQLGSRRDDIVLASKFGIYRDPADKYTLLIDGSRDYVKRACEASLQRLNVDCIDLYYVHRRDPNTPIEETMQALAELVQEGKIKAIGLSEVSVETLRRAHAVHPVAALQSEYSLWTRDLEQDMLPALRELGVALVAYSPLGRGFLTGSLSKEQLSQSNADSDFRAKLPRFQGENFDRNMQLVEALSQLSDELGFTPAQLALAWLLEQYDDLHVIPGTKRIKYLTGNFAAQDVQLSPAHLAMLDELFAPHAVAGLRYPEAILKGTNI
ncbi:aldo/keto reductase [Atopomonas hussainii]|uniref:aldo/keto reductase n=1 Tax=Atopomonas hussainii TaxID=1429083 RepID=UPI00090004CE|nr:aldo/keto reductase [Atopomonas hussainii]